MNKRKIERVLLLFLIAISMSSLANAIVCITMSNGNEWKDAKIKLSEPAYFSFRIYNSSADGRICDASNYEINIELIDSDKKLEDVFEWTMDTPAFELENGENQRGLLTLIPKELGFYTIKVTAKLMPKGEGGTQLIYTTSAKINASVSLEGDESYNEIPFWKIRKDCPNGLVVKEGEECPRICKDGTKILESKGEKCKEDQIDFFASLGLKGEMIFWGGIGGILATIAILGIVAYRRKQAYAINEEYNAENN